MRIYVIRHGETQANERGILQGQSNSPLLESGLALARTTGEAMRDIRFDAAFSSPLPRALITALEVLVHSGNTNLKLHTDDRLLEFDMGDVEGKRFKPGESEVDPELTRAFFEDPFAFDGFPGGENVQDVLTRTQEFLRDLAAGKLGDYGTVLVSTHGFALRAMLNFLYPNPADFWQGHVPYNCSVSILEAGSDGLHLAEFDKVYYDPALCVDRYAEY